MPKVSAIIPTYQHAHFVAEAVESVLAQTYKDYEIAVYNAPDELADKILYYLQHDDKREAIVQAGYERTIRDHIYERRFRDIFARVNPELNGVVTT